MNELALLIEIGTSLRFKNAPSEICMMRGRKFRGPIGSTQTNQQYQETGPDPQQKSRSPPQIGDFYLTHNQYLMIMSKLPKNFSLQPPKNEKKRRKLLSELNDKPTKREMKERKQEEKFPKDKLKRQTSRMTIVSNESADVDDQQSFVTVSLFESRKSQPGQQHEKIVSYDTDKEKEEENQAEPSIHVASQDLPPQNSQDLKKCQVPNDEVPAKSIQSRLQQKSEQGQEVEQQHKPSIERTGSKRGRKSKSKFRSSVSKPSNDSSIHHKSEENLNHNHLPKLEDVQIYETRFSKEWQILEALQRHSLIGPFISPVDERRDRAPGYYAAIKYPMDLSTIEKNIKGQAYADVKEFYSDVEQIWKNSIIYNKPGCAMRKVTAELQRFYEGLKNGKNLKEEVHKRGRRI